MATLDDVLRSGEGIERPFRCSEHNDHQSSASVNVLKGVWCCYACGAAGTVSGKKAPSVTDLEAMLEPEKSVRVYAETYLRLFDVRLGNFAARFPEWLRRHAGLGFDPLTGDATFPVRTPELRLAGVGRRKENPGDGPRYVYPPRWAASRSLFVVGAPGDVLVLVEGAADASSVAETGAYAAGVYGSGLHKPQIELVMRLNPKLVLVAFDADEAGQAGMKRAVFALNALVPTEFVDWRLGGKKDPAELEVGVRSELLAQSVVGASYGARQDIAARWTARAVQLQAAHSMSVED